MKKLLIILGFWLACLVPSISPAEEDLFFSPKGCQVFAHNAAVLAIVQKDKHFVTGKQLFEAVFSKDFLAKTEEKVQELVRVLSYAIVKDTKTDTPEEIAQTAINFCFSHKGNIGEMTDHLKVYVGEKSI